MRAALVKVGLVLATTAGVPHRPEPATAPRILNPATTEPAVTMVASWYGESHRGRLTANGERFNPDDLTAASKTLKFGTRLLLGYQGRQVVVRINDRGPYVPGRSLDLSRAAADALGLTQRGVGAVTVRQL